MKELEIINANNHNREMLVQERTETGEFEKGHPVGYINKYGKQKQGDGSWKYVGKQSSGAAKPTAKKESVPEKKTDSKVTKEEVARLKADYEKKHDIANELLNHPDMPTKSERPAKGSRAWNHAKKQSDASTASQIAYSKYLGAKRKLEEQGNTEAPKNDQKSLMKPHAGKTYQFTERGSGEKYTIYLEATDGSHLVDMQWDDMSLAKKYAEKHNFPMKQETYSPKSDAAFKVRQHFENNSLSRKPVDLDEMKSSSNTLKVRPGSTLEKEIGKLTEKDLTGWAKNGIHQDLPKDVQGGLFVGKIGNDRFLINTEGASYIRYGGKLDMGDVKKGDDSEALFDILTKGKEMPIGTISNGRKKVAQGKWVPVSEEKSGGGQKFFNEAKASAEKKFKEYQKSRLNSKEREADFETFKRVYMKTWNQYLDKEIRAMAPDTETKNAALKIKLEGEIKQLSGLLDKLKAEPKKKDNYGRYQQKGTIANVTSHLKRAKSQLSKLGNISKGEDMDALDILEKGHPVGYINSHGKQKQADGSWKYVGRNKTMQKISTRIAESAGKDKKPAASGGSTGIKEVDEALAKHGKSSDTPNISLNVLEKHKKSLSTKVGNMTGKKSAASIDRFKLKKMVNALGKVKEAIAHHEKTIAKNKKVEKGMEQKEFDTPEEALDFLEKAHPVGYINAHGKQKQADGTWKYVGRPGQGGARATSTSTSVDENAEAGAADHTHLLKDIEKIARNAHTPQQKMKELIDVGLKDVGKIATITGMNRSDVAQHFIDANITPEPSNIKAEDFKNLLPRVDVEKRWKSYRVMLNMVAKGLGKSMIAYGTGGVGKTYNQEEVFKAQGLKKFEDGMTPGFGDYDYVSITGKSTPAAMFKALYEHNGKTVVFDDCDSVLEDDTSINILKGALDTTGDGTISYLSGRKMKDSNGEEIPQRFTFLGKALFISNLTAEKMPQPLRSRAFTVDLTMNADETVTMLKKIAPQMKFKNNRGERIEVSEQDRNAAVALIDKYKNQVDIGDLNARTLGQIAMIHKQFRENPVEGLSWEDTAVTMLS